MVINYKAKVWKTGNSSVVTVPQELQGKVVEIFVREIADALPDMRSARRFDVDALAEVAQNPDQGGAKDVPLNGRKPAKNEPARIRTTQDAFADGSPVKIKISRFVDGTTVYDLEDAIIG